MAGVTGHSTHIYLLYRGRDCTPRDECDAFSGVDTPQCNSQSAVIRSLGELCGIALRKNMDMELMECRMNSKKFRLVSSWEFSNFLHECGGGGGGEKGVRRYSNS